MSNAIVAEMSAAERQAYVLSLRNRARAGEQLSEEELANAINILRADRMSVAAPKEPKAKGTSKKVSVGALDDLLPKDLSL